MILVKQKLSLWISFILFYYIIQMMTFNRLGLDLIPSYFLLDILFVGLIGSVIYLFKSSLLSLIYLVIWIIGFNLLMITNITMFQIFGDLFSIENVFLLNEAGQAFNPSFLNTGDLMIAASLIISFIIINIILNRFLKLNQEKYKQPKRLKRLVVFLILFSTLSMSYMGHIYYVSRNIRINGEVFTEHFYLSTLKKSAMQSYGMLSFYYRESRLVWGEFDDEDVLEEPKVVKSPYNGLLKDMNVITIMIESGQEMAINPVLTPNLYRLREEGLYFSQNYSVNKTNVSEQIGIVGSYPTSNWSKDTEVPFALPQLMNENYVTRYFHDNNEGFYQRGNIIKQFGFEESYFHDDLFQEDLPNWDGNWSWNGDYTLDSITIERILPHMIDEDEPFYSFWTSLSMHGPYSDNSRSNRDLFEQLGYFDTIDEAMASGVWVNPLLGDATGEFQFKYYQAATMDFDVALGRLIEELANKDLLDSTLLVLYSDHHVYYHDLHLRLNGLEAAESYKADLLYDTILYMWNPVLNETYMKDYGSTKIDTFTSPYIIVPTIIDLLGIPYDSNTYLSHSFFSEDYLPLFYSHQQKALMNQFYYSQDLESILYRVKEENLDAEAEFLFQALQLLQRQSKLDAYYRSLAYKSK